MGLSKTSGRVDAGFEASLVLLRADPTTDIANTRSIESVVLRGELLNRSRLDRLLEESRVPRSDSAGSSEAR